jgi:hypothetical protein
MGGQGTSRCWEEEGRGHERREGEEGRSWIFGAWKRLGKRCRVERGKYAGKRTEHGEIIILCKIEVANVFRQYWYGRWYFGS